jgi:hypothetical protein
MPAEELARIREELAALREEFRLASVEGSSAMTALDLTRLQRIADQQHALIERFNALINSVVIGRPIE